MTKNILRTTAAALAVSVTLAACSPNQDTNTAKGTSETVTEAVAANASMDTAKPGTAEQVGAANSDATVFKDNEWSMDDAQDFTGGTITSAGVYKVTGKVDNITIAAPDDAKVVLVLSDATVGTITVNTADDVAIYTEGTNNTGAISAESDLTLSGTGTLNVTADEDGIVSKDDLVVLSGTTTVKAGDDGLRGTDSVTIKGGNLKVEATGGDAIKSTKDDDETKGWVRIQDGTLKRLFRL